MNKSSKVEKISVPLCVILILGFLGTSMVSYLISSRSVREQITANQLPLTGDNVYSELQKDIIRPINLSADMAHNTFLRDWLLNGESSDEEITRYLSEVKAKNDTVTAFLVSEKTRAYYHAEGPLKVVHELEPRDRWYFRVKDLHKDYETNVDPDLANGDESTVFINYRVLDYSGNFIGATGVGLTLENVQEKINFYESKYNSKVYFTNSEGIVTLAGANASNLGESIQTSSGIGQLAEQILVSTTQKQRLDYHSEEGARIQVNARFVEELNWHLILEYDESAVVGPLKSILKVNLIAGGLATLIVLAIMLPALRSYLGKLKKTASTDILTGLLNRQGLSALANNGFNSKAQDYHDSSVIYFDIDNFKSINDTYGHAAGDVVLRTVAKCARSVLREKDLIGRWGGEEFVVVLANSKIDYAKNIAERIRLAIAQHNYDSMDKPVTVSIGVTERFEYESLDQMLHHADTALYAAKNQGKNRVVTWMHAINQS